MQISTKDWKNYINRLSALSTKAASLMSEYVAKNGFADTETIIEYAYGLVTKYGEGSAELSCQMYDAIAEMEGKIVPAAVPANTATYSETAKAINGCLLQSVSGQKIDQVVGRLVKQAGADTTLKNAVRDGAYFAWVPMGDTCPYCLMLGAIGWQKAGKKTLNGNHAKHIHANCDCQYVVDFKGNMHIEGYDYSKMQKEMLEAAGVDTSDLTENGIQSEFDDLLRTNGRKSSKGQRDALNALRRENYEQNKELINAQKRKAYEIRVGGRALNKNKPKSFNPYNTEPGIGKLVFNNGTSQEELRDRETATWLHNIFGGDIECLAEISTIGKNPDIRWNGDYWEFKAPTTKNAIDDRIKSAKRQIIEAQTRDDILGNKCGIVIDISNIKISEEEAIETIVRRSQQRLPDKTNVIIRKDDDFIGLYTIKKEAPNS